MLRGELRGRAIARVVHDRHLKRLVVRSTNSHVHSKAYRSALHLKSGRRLCTIRSHGPHSPLVTRHDDTFYIVCIRKYLSVHYFLVAHIHRFTKISFVTSGVVCCTTIQSPILLSFEACVCYVGSTEASEMLSRGATPLIRNAIVHRNEPCRVVLVLYNLCVVRTGLRPIHCRLRGAGYSTRQLSHEAEAQKDKQQRHQGKCALFLVESICRHFLFVFRYYYG